MNSYKCDQCGLVNWTNAECCKRCQMPNPYLNPADGYSNNQAHIQNFAAPMPDYFAPPPPNVFGASAGTTAAPVGFAAPAPPAFGNRPPIRAVYQPEYSHADLAELTEAEKQIRNAWVCGAVICGLSTLVAILFAAVAKSSGALPATPVEIMISVVIFGTLTIGVYFKSRACAVLLCGVYILDKIISTAASGKYTGWFLGAVFIYYFACGIKGTFTYQRLKHRRN